MLALAIYAAFSGPTGEVRNCEVQAAVHQVTGNS
jgi:hypothetical protein